MNKAQMCALQVGDIVVDCRGFLLMVTNIFEERYPPTWFYKLTSYLPGTLGITVDDLYLEYFKGTIWDKHLTLEGNRECSALYCCEVL